MDTERLNALMAEWHEAGRKRFEASYPNLNYDENEPHHWHDRRKYIALDEGRGGAFLVNKETGTIYRLKSVYGVPNLRKVIGHIDLVTGAELQRRRWW